MNIKDLTQYSKSLKILYVEDNDEARESTLLMLENFFDDITIAINGDDGYEKYINHYNSKNRYFDIVISDINMPKMDGTEMCKLIFGHNKNQHILMISAYNDSERLQELLNMGVSNYIHKPLRLDKFISVLEDITINIRTIKTKENELKEIEQLNNGLDALVDSFDSYVIASRTDLKGTITYVSKAYENISGYTKSELIGQSHNIVRHPDMLSGTFKNIWETIKDGKLWVGEIKNLNKDGSSYWVDANIAPYYDKNNKHVGYSAIRVDITSQKALKVLNLEVNNLLNNAGQGFLSFNKNMQISKSFSKECLNIFKLKDIYNCNISDILFADDLIKKDLFEDGISRTLLSDEDVIKEMFLTLLPIEHIVNGKDISIEYKLLDDDKFMMILTDITNTKKLESKLKKQNQLQKMIVAVASNKNDFIEIKEEFEQFLIAPIDDLREFLRQLHTFKGVFAQKEMVNIVDTLHSLETNINKIVQNDNTTMENIIDVFKDYDLEKTFNIDLEIINSTLGDCFLTVSPSSSIDISKFDNLKLKIEQLESKDSSNSLQGILYDFERMRYESLYLMLNSYPAVVKQVSNKLGKKIYPLIIEGDKKLNVSSEFKPFIKSLIHLFNNCIDHGIEDIETRVEIGKDETARIVCKFNEIDGNIQLIITDDGSGIDIEKLVQNAIKKNIITQKELKSININEKLMLIFTDRLTTKDKVSYTSGRGIGMSALKNETEKLDGVIDIKSKQGSGVEFIFTLPIK